MQLGGIGGAAVLNTVPKPRRLRVAVTATKGGQCAHPALRQHVQLQHIQEGERQYELYE